MRSLFVASRSWRSALVVAAMLVLYWWMAVSTAPRIGVTADEPLHLGGGYACWRFDDYRLQPENGTLAMRIAALPLLAMHLRWTRADDPFWRQSDDGPVGYEFLFRLGNPRDRMLWAARAMIALVGAFTVWLIWRWARALFGPTGGWLALILAVFSPTLLAHGALATSDMTITACFLAVVTLFWRLLHVVTWPRLLATVVAAGAVLLAKMSGGLAAPMLIVLLVLRWIRPAPLVIRVGRRTRWIRSRTGRVAATVGLAIATAAGAVTLVWGAYGFRYTAFAPRYAVQASFEVGWPELLNEAPFHPQWPGDVRSALAPPQPQSAPTGVTRTLGWLRAHRLLPEAYLWGLAHTYKFSRQRPAFLNGKFSLTGWRSFFPWTFWLKTTLPVLALFLAGTAGMILTRRRGWPTTRRITYRAAPLLALFGIYWAVALATHLNIGHRHILPIYPVVFVCAGGAVLWLQHRTKALIAVALVLAAAAQATDSLAVRPFYLSYFQPLAGGPANGWRHLVDSSYDWGQGLPDLAAWLDRRAAAGDHAPVYLTYFGADSPRDRGLRVIRFADEINDHGERLFPVRPRGGWFAISATHFQRVYLDLAGPWTVDRENLYQRLRHELAAAAPDGNAPLPPRQLLRAAMDFETLEFGRLCHFLRHRDPVTVIGGSILMFRLTDQEVARALDAPLSSPPQTAPTR